MVKVKNVDVCGVCCVVVGGKEYEGFVDVISG